MLCIVKELYMPCWYWSIDAFCATYCTV